MSILANKDTRVIFQGLTGATASRMAERAIAQGTTVVGGVRPGKGGSRHLGLPVFDSVAEAVRETGANATAVVVPPLDAAAAITEAIDAEVGLIVCVTERIPVLDMVGVRARLENSKSVLIGPNSFGIISPGQCRIGVMPDRAHQPGKIGILSRSATLAYMVVEQTSQLGLGQSTCVGIGGDPVHGIGFAACMKFFADDPQTEGVILLGEIGGTDEEEAARFFADGKMNKPVVAYVAGRHVPTRRRMGHAGTTSLFGEGSAENKIGALIQAGVRVATSPPGIGQLMVDALRTG